MTTADGAWAQFDQYTPPGGPTDRPESRKERLEREIEGARYHLGPVRIAPWIGLRDASYVRGLYSDQDDASGFTATVGAGLSSYLRTGRKVIWTGRILPEYTWWSRESDRSRLNGRYGLGLHAFFNRLTVEATATRQQAQTILTPELPQPASARTDQGQLQAEIWMTGALSAFADTRVANVRYLDAGEIEAPGAERLDLLDRREAVTRAGVRWRPREPWSIGLGAEVSRVDFESASALDRSNEGTAPVLEVRFDRSKLFVEVDLAARSLEARQGSRFLAFDQVTGRASVSVRPRRRTDVWVYGSRNLVYSLDPGTAYVEDQRLGAALGTRLGGRTVARVFFETGQDDYTAFDPEALPRSDDVLSWGGSMTFRLRGPVALTLQATRSRFESNTPGNDRSYTSVGTQINLFGNR